MIGHIVAVESCSSFEAEYERRLLNSAGEEEEGGLTG